MCTTRQCSNGGRRAPPRTQMTAALTKRVLQVGGAMACVVVGANVANMALAGFVPAYTGAAVLNIMSACPRLRGGGGVGVATIA